MSNMYDLSNMEKENYKGFRIVKFDLADSHPNALLINIKLTKYRVMKNRTRYGYADFDSKKEAKKFIDNYEKYDKKFKAIAKKINTIDTEIRRLRNDRDDLVKAMDMHFYELKGILKV